MRHLYIPVLLLCGLAAPAWAGQPINTPRLASADNFRDLAGISAAYGGGQTDPAGIASLRPGVVYRANALTLSPADRATLTKLGIGEDIDLRTPAEIQKQPDRLPAGVIYKNVNIFGGQKLPALDLATAAAADQLGDRFTGTLSPIRWNGGISALPCWTWPTPKPRWCSIVPPARTAPAGWRCCCKVLRVCRNPSLCGIIWRATPIPPRRCRRRC